MNDTDVGDYSDPGDNNDLFNAMNLGYFDNAAATENMMPTALSTSFESPWNPSRRPDR